MTESLRVRQKIAYKPVLCMQVDPFAKPEVRFMIREQPIVLMGSRSRNSDFTDYLLPSSKRGRRHDGDALPRLFPE